MLENYFTGQEKGNGQPYRITDKRRQIFMNHEACKRGKKAVVKCIYNAESAEFQKLLA